MDRSEIIPIVRDVVSEFLSTKGMLEKSKFLVLLHARSSNPANVWEVVRNLSNKYKLTLCVSKHWTNIPEDLQSQTIILLNEENFNMLQEVVKQHKTLIVPTFSYSMLSQLDQLVDDDLHIWLMLQMQLDGKEIIVANDEIKLTTMRMIHLSVNLKDRIEEKINRLTSTGIYFTSSEQVAKKLNKAKKDQNDKTVLVLEKHIKSLVNEGRTKMKLPKNHVITPMAKDLMRKHRVQIDIVE